MPDISLGNARIVTMRELANSASQIMRELNESNRPAVVTKHGKFVAVIQPLAGAQVEAISLTNLAVSLADDAAEDAVDGTEVRRRFGLNVRKRGGN
ncbi:hypothetical protein [Streptomyces sp. NPDC014623]|uniref:hypothetical protein n=1 Tax=Streptomyces sp. NPDC014623 TaxID=3364875 RepID=UPI0036F7976C